MELLDIVDENGNYTGEVVERSAAQKLNLLHYEVIIIPVNDKKQILLQKRSKNKKYFPNKWTFSSGLVISKETLDDAAIRETKEELGITISKNDLKVLEENINMTRFYYFFCNKKENEFTIQESELSAVKWYDILDVIKKVSNKDDSIIIKESRLYLLERLYNILNKK